MKTKISKKSVDSIRRRETARASVLTVKKFSRKCSSVTMSFPKAKTKKSSLKKFLRLTKKRLTFSLARIGIMKIIVINLAIGINLLGVSSIGGTASFFTDSEISRGNTLAAGTLDFSLISPTENFVRIQKVSFNIDSGDASSRKVAIQSEGKVPFDYFVSVENLSDDLDYCNSLKIIAKLENETSYTGDLSNFKTPNTTITDDKDNWFFAVYSENANFLNKNCSFNLVFQGWQTGDGIDFEKGNFSDEESLENKLESLYDTPDQSDDEGENTDEDEGEDENVDEDGKDEDEDIDEDNEELNEDKNNNDKNKNEEEDGQKSNEIRIDTSLEKGINDSGNKNAEEIDDIKNKSEEEIILT